MASIQVNVADPGSLSQKPVLTILVDPSSGTRAINSDGPADDVVTVSSDDASGVVTETKSDVKEILDAEKESSDAATGQRPTEPAAPAAEEKKDPLSEPAQVAQESTEGAKEEAQNPFEGKTNEVPDPTLEAPVAEPVFEPVQTSEDVPSVRRASVFKEVEVETNNTDGSTTVTVTEPPVFVPGDNGQPKRTITTVLIESPQKDDASTLNEAAPEDSKKDEARKRDKIRAQYPEFFLTLMFGHALKDEIKQKLLEQAGTTPSTEKSASS